MDERTMPAERAVIGGIVLSPELLEKAVGQIKPQDFSVQEYADIFAAAVDMLLSGVSVDAVTLLGRLGAEYNVAIMDAARETPSLSGFQHYVDLVLDGSRRRKLMDEILKAQLALSEGADLAEVEAIVCAAVEKSDAKEGVYTAGEAMDSAIDALEAIRESGRPNGITSGFDDVDRCIGRFLPGMYYTIAARSGMGKTAFLLCIAKAAAKSGRRVLIFSLEMPAEGLATRLIANETQYKHDIIRFSKYSGAQLQTMRTAAKSDYMRNIIIDDRPGLTMSQIRSVVRRVKPDAVYIDYIGLIRTKKSENRRVEVDLLSHELKETAKLYNVPVIVLAQLNRETEGRKTGRPTLADIRESDAICQDSDAVMLLYREAQYNSKAEPYKAELIVAKNRQGRTGMIPLSWDGETMTFRGVYVDGSLPRPTQHYDDVEEL